MGKEPERLSHASNIINALIIENASVDPARGCKVMKLQKPFETKRKEALLMHQDSPVDSHYVLICIYARPR